ncbi:hypothetical protein ACFLQJ_01570 [Calditrichota bacterium]
MFRKKKIIIGIHGLGNKPPAKFLENDWKKAIIEGLESLCKKSQKVNFELVYWTDLVYLHPLNPQIKDTNDPLRVDHPYTPGAQLTKKGPSKLKVKIRDKIEKFMENIFLDDDLNINFSDISDKIIHKYFKDLESYYNARYIDFDGDEYYMKDRMRLRLAKVLKKHRRKDILLIAHSMGSIIAYDVMTQSTPEIKITTWITIGSPLGIPIVVGKIAAEQKEMQDFSGKLKAPENILRGWYNLSDLEDKIAINYDLNDDYEPNSHDISPRDVIVYNTYENSGKKNPHSVFGYLRTPEMSELIDKFLKYKHPNFFSRMIKKISGKKD